MNAGGLIVVISGGGLGLAVAILVAFSVLFARKRLDTSARELNDSDAELAQARAQIQADVERGQRGF